MLERNKKMEFLYDNLSLNEKNHLTIGGVDVVDLKKNETISLKH